MADSELVTYGRLFLPLYSEDYLREVAIEVVQKRERGVGDFPCSPTLRRVKAASMAWAIDQGLLVSAEEVIVGDGLAVAYALTEKGKLEFLH